MKIGFIPHTQADWRLLLRLAKLIRLASRQDLTFIVCLWEKENQQRNTRAG